MPPANPSTSSPPQPAPRKTRWLLYVCGAFLALILAIVATVLITLWWMQRPIKPVDLSVSEKATVEEKLQRINGGTVRSPSSPALPAESSGGTASQPQEQPYQPGSKNLILTEREINGLLNANTDLGKSVRLEFTRDAINAYVAVPIPEDFPVAGGKMFRARGRFRLSLGNGGVPYAILEDVTVFGLSLPKAWLGGLKGENLLGEAMGNRNGSPVFRGIKSLQVEPGALVLTVED